MMTKNILLADSDSELTAILSKYLQGSGYTTSIAQDGEIALKKALNQSFDAIILDVILPKKNGFEVLQQIRAHSSLPAIFLTSENNPIDNMVGFEIGADDYITKPCNPRELIARLNTILKKSQKTTTQPIVDLFPIYLDSATRTVKLFNKPLELTNTEFNILEMLTRSPGQAFSKEELTEYALGRKLSAFDRSIDVHISNLRNKLGDNEENEPWLKTVRGFGYAFQVPKKAGP